MKFLFFIFSMYIIIKLFDNNNNNSNLSLN